MARHVGPTAALREVWLWSLAAGLYCFVPLWIGSPPWGLDFSPVGDAVLGFTLGFLLVFRMNRAYERWWEARALWGKLVNVSRNLAVKAKELARPDEEERRQVRNLIVGFAFGLKKHLRGGAVLREVPGFESTSDDPQHVPTYIVDRVYELFRRWSRDDGRLLGEDLWLLDREARELLEVAGASERIKNTLMSQSFATLVRQALVVYLLYLPWSIAPDLGWAAVPVTVLVSYFVVGAEGIAFYVERPFGVTEDHLDLEGICQGIDQSVSEVLGLSALTSRADA